LGKRWVKGRAARMALRVRPPVAPYGPGAPSPLGGSYSRSVKCSHCGRWQMLYQNGPTSCRYCGRQL
jgi:hypothetical protein